MPPKRQTRRRIAYGMLGFIFIVLAWMILTPGDLGENEADLAKVAVASFCLALGAFIAEQGIGDHSERKTGSSHDP